MRRIAAGISASILTFTALVGAPDASHAVGPIRVLIVGDSVTNGSPGDYTWRYRLWKNLVAGGASVDFVGPDDGVCIGGPNPCPQAIEYADPDFDHDHASRWGLALWQTLVPADNYPSNPYSGDPRHQIDDLTRSYQPDVVIDDLGLNDIVFGGSANELYNDDVDFLNRIRAINPDATVIYGCLPQVWKDAEIGGYNDMLGGLAALSTSTSRVLVTACPALDPVVDTYDDTHPSATGEVKIARVFADSLNAVGIGSAASWPSVVNGPTTVGHLTVTTSSLMATVHLDTPLGATGQRLWYRYRHRPWKRFKIPVLSGTPMVTVGMPKPGEVAFRLQAYKGTAVSPLFSNRVVVQLTR